MGVKQHKAATSEPTIPVLRGLLNLLNNLRQGCRLSLSQSITLVESTTASDKAQSKALINQVLLSKHKPAFRIGLSGSPGVGKSCFIESMGAMLLNKGHSVAVLAIDPSSQRTRGSILGDKTRMPILSSSLNAYVRPSPSSCLGGVQRNTCDAILLCEEAGYDTIMVETIGVGQSETLVADLVDMFCLLVAPAAGDELQGFKKGIVELADLILVTKSDGDLLSAANMAHAEYTSALKFVHPTSKSWTPLVF